jgi:putative tryptophan/tyrosine transport system substrate-binding protein
VASRGALTALGQAAYTRTSHSGLTRQLQPARRRSSAAAARVGWVEGRTIAIEYRWAATQRFDAIAAEFVRSKVDVIFTSGTPPTVATKRATSEIPIVFVPAGDPLASGLVASLARPGGNITGLSNQTADIGGKRVELLRELADQVRRLAIMVKSDNASAASEMRQVKAAASTLGIEVVPLEIGRAFETLKGRADALYVVVDSLVTTHANRINTLALGARLPTMHGARELVVAGGLMSYAASYEDLYRRGAEYIDKILRGTKPADIPVEQPTKFDLVINLTTAKALGLTIPESFLVRADEVIE